MNDNNQSYYYVVQNPMTGMITRKFLANLTFRPFTDADYMSYSGVESPVPMIAEFEDESQSFVVVLDGDMAELYVSDAEGYFDIGDMVANIRELPMGPTKEELIREARVKLNELQQTLRELEAQ